LKEGNMTTFRFVCVSFLKNRWDFPSPYGKSERRRRGIFSQVPVIVAGRSEHPFISICDLHDQLNLNVEKV
jgi:hypothetical protein